MAFMGLFVLGVVSVTILVCVGLYLLTALVLLIIGLVGLIRDSKRARDYAAWTQLQPTAVAPYRRKRSPRVLLWIGGIMWGLFAAFVAFTMDSFISSSKDIYEEQQANRNLFDCLREEDYEAARERLDAGASIDCSANSNADPSAPAQPGEDTLLYNLCSGDMLEEDDRRLRNIEFLLDNGADIEWQVYHHEPSYSDHHGGNAYGFDFPDRCGMTPLMAAACSGRVETVKLLLSHGADVNAVTYSGANALMYAVGSDKGKKSAAVVRLLIEAGIDVNAYDNFGQDVWDYAEWTSNREVKEALREGTSRSDYAPDPSE